MELIVAHLGDPVPAVVVVKGKHRSVGFSQIPDPHSPVRACCRHRVQTALVVGNVEHLVSVGCEAQITIARLLPEVDYSDLVFKTKSE